MSPSACDVCCLSVRIHEEREFSQTCLHDAMCSARGLLLGENVGSPGKSDTPRRLSTEMRCSLYAQPTFPLLFHLSHFADYGASVFYSESEDAVRLSPERLAGLTTLGSKPERALVVLRSLPRAFISPRARTHADEKFAGAPSDTTLSGPM